jgi:hypothetical protein
MPLRISNTAGGTDYANPLVGGAYDVTNLKLDVSTLTTNEVDSKGFLKPGVPLQLSSGVGVLISGASQTVYGVTFEPIKLRDDNSGLGTDTTDPIIAVATAGLLNLDIIEDNLGRVLSANELAALTAGGFKLTTT